MGRKNQGEGKQIISPSCHHFLWFFLEPFWKTLVRQANFHTEGLSVLHHGSLRRHGQSRNLSPQMLCIVSFCLSFTTVSMHLPSETSGLRSVPRLCFPEDSAHSRDPHVGYAIEFMGSLGNGGLTCF